MTANKRLVAHLKHNDIITGIDSSSTTKIRQTAASNTILNKTSSHDCVNYHNLPTSKFTSS